MTDVDWRAEWEAGINRCQAYSGYETLGHRVALKWPILLAANAALRAAEAARDDYRAKWESVSATLCEVARVGRQQNEMAERILTRIRQVKADLALEVKDD